MYCSVAGLLPLHLDLDRLSLLASLSLARFAERAARLVADLGCEVPERGRGLLQRAGRSQRLVERGDLIAQVLLIFRDFAGEMSDLRLHDEAEHAKNA